MEFKVNGLGPTTGLKAGNLGFLRFKVSGASLWFLFVRFLVAELIALLVTCVHRTSTVGNLTIRGLFLQPPTRPQNILFQSKKKDCAVRTSRQRSCKNKRHNLRGRRQTLPPRCPCGCCCCCCCCCCSCCCCRCRCRCRCCCCCYGCR